MKQVVIDKGIPMPRHRDRRNSGIGLAMRMMEVGDSFVYPSEGPAKVVLNRARASCSRMRPLKFILAVVIEDDKEVVRVWRKK